MDNDKLKIEMKGVIDYLSTRVNYPADGLIILINAISVIGIVEKIPREDFKKMLLNCLNFYDKNINYFNDYS